MGNRVNRVKTLGFIVLSFGLIILNLNLVGFFTKPSISKRELAHRKYDQYWLLEENEKVIYECLLNRAIDITEGNTQDLSIDIPLSKENLQGIFLTSQAKEIIKNINFEKIWSAVRADYGEYFWFADYAKITFTSAHISYDNPYFRIILGKAEGVDLEKDSRRIREFLNAEYESSSLDSIATYILENHKYNYKDPENIKNNILITALENGAPLNCEGYAVYFKTLARKAGYDVYERIGTYGDTGHAWNLLVKNDKFYLYDLTGGVMGAMVSDAYETHPEEGNAYTMKK